MGTGILYNGITQDPIYDWNTAFKNEEFISYIMNKYPSIYTGNEEDIDPYKYFEVTRFTQVMFPSCYKNIGAHAFDGCTNLNIALFTSSRYTNSQRYEIGEAAFANCNSLYSIRIHTIRKIQKRAFANLPSLVYIYGTSFTSNPSDYSWMWYIGEEAFANCNNILNFYSFSCVECIDTRAFANLKNNYLYVGTSICGRINDYAFENCSNLQYISFNASMYYNPNPYLRCSLGSSIFQGCTSLSIISIYGCYDIKSDTLGNLTNSLKEATFDIPNALYGAAYMYDLLINIGSYAFAGYSKLQTINASCVKEIGEYAFAGCSSLQHMSAGFALCEKIKANAFYGCTSISQLYMNNYASSYMISMSKKMVIESGAFNGLDNLLETNLYFCDNIPDELFYGHSKLSWCGIQNYLRYGINYSVTIGKKAFANCHSLTNIICPCVNIIEESAFYGCINLSSCTIGTDLCKEIKQNAFAGCGNLSGYLTFNGGGQGNNIKLSIDEYAFNGCRNIKQLNLINIEYIDDNAFTGCTNIDTMYIYNYEENSSFILPTNNFLRQGINIALTNFIFNGLLRIEYEAFAGFYKLSNVFLMNCQYIGSYAFVGCSNLTHIELNNREPYSSIVELEDITAFNGINSEYTIIVPESLYSEYINDNMWNLISSHISSRTV